MTNVTKPGIKDLEINEDIVGFVCNVCNLKYRLREAKIRCERWHVAKDE